MDDIGNAGDDRGMTGLTLLCADPCYIDTTTEVLVDGDDSLDWEEPLKVGGLVNGAQVISGYNNR